MRRPRLTVWRTGAVYAALAAADADGALSAEELERLAVAAFLLGRDGEVPTVRERAFEAYLARGLVERAAECGFWLGFHRVSGATFRRPRAGRPGSGRHPGQVPIDIDSRRGRRAVPVVMFVFRHVVTRRTPMGRKAYAQRLGRSVSLVHNKLADLDAAGITRIGAIEQVRDGHPVAGRGELPPVNTVVSCTGLRPDHRFLELPVFGADSRPRQQRGVSVVPGLYFLGLEFQFALASGQIQGLDRDARYLLRQLRAMSRVPAAA